MPQKPINYGTLWTREELVLAFDLYCRIPFQQTKASNPAVKELASILNRSPASVARKLGNFGAFDPELKRRNISGLTHFSKLDAQIWDEFHSDWNALSVEAVEIRESKSDRRKRVEIERAPSGPSERTVSKRERIHQAFFRDAVLSGYNGTCCVTGISIPSCLVAGHIVPWSVDERYRTDPTNGLCLSATFDRLFDAGLICISDEFTVVVSSEIIGRGPGPNRQHIASFHNSSVMLPARFLPSRQRLQWHRDNVFRG